MSWACEGGEGGEALSERRILDHVTTSQSERVLESNREGGKKSKHAVTSAQHEHDEEMSYELQTHKESACDSHSYTCVSV